MIDLGSGLERIRIPNGPKAPAVALIMAALVRGRRLARAACLLFDNDLEREAEILVRSLMETAVGVAWLLRGDADERIQRLRLKDLDSRIGLLEQIQVIEAADSPGSHGEASDAAAVDLEATPPPDAPDILEALRAERSALEDQGVKRPPDVRTIAEQAGYGVGYVDFAFKSESRTHFRILGLEPLVEDRSEGDPWVINAGGAGTRLEHAPYETAAMWLLVAFKEVAKALPKFAEWLPRIEEIEAALEAGIDERESS